jgi:hypothetical protein
MLDFNHTFNSREWVAKRNLAQYATAAMGIRLPPQVG